MTTTKQPSKGPSAAQRKDGETPFLNMAAAAEFLTRSDEERMEYALFAEHYGEYAPIMSKLYPLWRQLNTRCTNTRVFQGRRLTEPHLTIGFCPPRALGYCRRLADHGGFMQITVRQNIFNGTHCTVSKNWNDSLGVKRLVDDILLHEMVHQYHFEVTGTPELKQGGHGKAFRDTCNHISEHLFEPESHWVDEETPHHISKNGTFGPRINEHWKVYVRRRGHKDVEKRQANHWPLNIRPDGYYGDHVEAGNWIKPKKPRHIPTWYMIFENLVAYYEAGQIADFIEEAKRELKKHQDADCPECIDHWPSLWDAPVCKLEALKPKGLPSHWLGQLPSLLKPHNADSFDPSH